MNLPSAFLQALIVLVACVASAASRAGEVPQAMRRDFTTARNHVLMKWNPQGYWVSPAGAFRTGGSTKDVCAVFTETEMSRGRIPQGYSFSVSGTGQFIVSDRPLSELVTPQPAVPGPVVAAPPMPVQVPSPDDPARSAAPVDPAPPPPPATINSTAMRASILDPVHAASPTAATPEAQPKVNGLPVPPLPSRPPINGIDGDMQNSFLSRHTSVFMLFDKDAGKWTSSEGAIKDVGSADEWCQQATAKDRLAKRIPATFSYKHVGGGQVEATRD